MNWPGYIVNSVFHIFTLFTYCMIAFIHIHLRPGNPSNSLLYTSSYTIGASEMR